MYSIIYKDGGKNSLPGTKKFSSFQLNFWICGPLNMDSSIPSTDGSFLAQTFGDHFSQLEEILQNLNYRTSVDQKFMLGRHAEQS